MSKENAENGDVQIVTGSVLRKQSRHVVTCPETDNAYLMRRPNISHLINSNVLPQNFVAKTLLMLGKEASQESAELTDKDLLNSEAVMQAMLTASMMKPQIVEHAEADDEVEFYDIPATDRAYLFLWAKGELPEVPLETVDGTGTTVGAVETFPSTEERGKPSGLSTDGEQAGEESEPGTRAA